ncbi:MAG TPA: ribonuclease G, partial [Anaeromyxobacter sp.]|nr:ribonuclease G [Anaeromyxobacter sp.]
MAGNSILVINAAGAETRVALVENGSIHEYYLERKHEKGIVGNIYKGRVVRVLPGMQAAFVDIGLEKAAFLYVGDVYGDPDFSEEFELTEGEHRAEVTEVPSEEEAEQAEASAREAVIEPASTPVPGALALEPEAPAEAEPAAPPEEGAAEPAPAEAAAEAPRLVEPSVPAVEAGPETPPEAASAELPAPPLTPIPLITELGMAPVPAVPGLLVPPLADAAVPPPEPIPAAAPEPGAAAEAAPASAPERDRIQARLPEAAREARGDREPG